MTTGTGEVVQLQRELQQELSALASSLLPRHPKFCISGWTSADLRILDRDSRDSFEDAELIDASTRKASSELEPGEIHSPKPGSPLTGRRKEPLTDRALHKSGMQNTVLAPVTTDNAEPSANNSNKPFQGRSVEELKEAAKQSFKARQASNSSPISQAAVPSGVDSMIRSEKHTCEMSEKASEFRTIRSSPSGPEPDLHNKITDSRTQMGELTTNLFEKPGETHNGKLDSLDRPSNESFNAEDVQDWLAITGFYDESRRGKLLSRRRRIRAIEEEKASLWEEELKENTRNPGYAPLGSVQETIHIACADSQPGETATLNRE